MVHGLGCRGIGRGLAGGLRRRGWSASPEPAALGHAPPEPTILGCAPPEPLPLAPRVARARSLDRVARACCLGRAARAPAISIVNPTAQIGLYPFGQTVLQKSPFVLSE